MKIRDIESFKGYFVREDGTILSNLGRGNRDKNKTVEMYELKGRKTRGGYLRVYMRNSEGKRVDRYIHRLVAQAFLENPEEKKVVHHLDCNRANNKVSNLEWVTHKENNEYTRLDGKVIRCEDTGRFVNPTNGIV